MTVLVSAGNADAMSSNFTTRAVGVGAVSVRTQRRIIAPLLCPAVSSQFATPGSRALMTTRSDPVGIDDGLVAVQAGLVAAVVDRLPPRVAERVAPVDALRRLDFEDQRLVGRELESADDGPVLRGRADRGAVDRRHEAVDGGAASKSRKNSRLSWTKSPSAYNWRDTATSGSTERSCRLGLRRRCARSAATTAPRCPSRRRSAAPTASGWSPSILQPVPSCSSADRIDLEVAVGVDLEIVDQQFVGRGHAVHGLQADIARGAPVAEQAVASRRRAAWPAV